MSPRFLVVDDDDGIRRLVSAVLRRQNYETDLAHDGQQAIEKLTDHGYDALFLDLMMPVCSGYEVIAHLREREVGRKCVVVMTAAGIRGTKDLDMTIVERVLHKPFDVKDIVVAAEAVLKRDDE